MTDKNHGTSQARNPDAAQLQQQQQGDRRFSTLTEDTEIYVPGSGQPPPRNEEDAFDRAGMLHSAYVPAPQQQQQQRRGESSAEGFDGGAQMQSGYVNTSLPSYHTHPNSASINTPLPSYHANSGSGNASRGGAGLGTQAAAYIATA